MKLFILFGLISINVFAKNAGDVIKAQDFNSSVFNIGSIQQSFLPEASFKKLNGSCWKMLDGTNIATSDYGQFLASEGLSTTIPDVRGKFLRAANAGATCTTPSNCQFNPDNTLVGNYQSDDNKIHSHSVLRTQSISGGEYALNSGFTNLMSGDRGGVYASNASGGSKFVAESGGNESRPKNISINYYIKINRLCNFN